MAGLGAGGLASFIGDSRQSLQGQFAMSCQGKSSRLFILCRKTRREGQGLILTSIKLLDQTIQAKKRIRNCYDL